MAHILHVTECAKGGVPLFIRRVSEGLNGEFSFDIVCPPSSELSVQPPRGARIHTVDMARQPHPLRDVIAAFGVRRVIRSAHYDAVHLHSSKAGIIGSLAKPWIEAPMIYTPHGLRSFAYPDKSPLKSIARLVEKWICRSVGNVVAVSIEEASEVVRSGIAPSEKVTVIENGVDLEDMSAPATISRADIGVPQDAYLVGTVGRLQAQKDPLLFIQAASIIADRIPGAHFVMVGDGPLESVVRQHIAAERLAGRFHLLGWRADATDILKLFDVFVLTSRYEGMPFVLLEAAAAGLPLVSTNVPGAQSLIDDGSSGLLAAVGAAEVIGAHLVTLHSDKTLRLELGNAARKSIAESHGLELMLDGWSETYRSVIPRSAAVSAPGKAVVISG
ncbi:MAG: glycosyltransferase family 4 protein [Anaerolineales bacterium]|nr:glycosyltransferase family 4 protein [Anaerolineales bacterium]